ncbi:MAG: T9SS type A sorting domain-containing protein [Flavobacteriales bacterium]
MKHIVLFVFSLLSLAVVAQCDPDFDFGDAEWGASPDPSVGDQFDTAYVDVPYADVFHVLVPTDASAIDPMFTLPLDSVILLNVTLIDTVTSETMALEDIGLEIVCNNLGSSPDPCTLISGAQYCASLEGTPTTGGVFQMSLDVNAYVTVFGVAVAQPYQFNGYILDVIGESTGNNVAESSNDIHWKLFPNPANDQLEIQGLPADAKIEIFNASGQLITVEESSMRGLNRSFETSSWTAGLYFVVSTTGHGVQSRQVVIEH